MNNHDEQKERTGIDWCESDLIKQLRHKRYQNVARVAIEDFCEAAVSVYLSTPPVHAEGDEVRDALAAARHIKRLSEGERKSLAAALLLTVEYDPSTPPAPSDWAGIVSRVMIEWSAKRNVDAPTDAEVQEMIQSTGDKPGVRITVEDVDRIVAECEDGHPIDEWDFGYNEGVEKLADRIKEAITKQEERG